MSVKIHNSIQNPNIDPDSIVVAAETSIRGRGYIRTPEDGTHSLSVDDLRSIANDISRLADQLQEEQNSLFEVFKNGNRNLRVYPDDINKDRAYIAVSNLGLILTKEQTADLAEHLVRIASGEFVS